MRAADEWQLAAGWIAAKRLSTDASRDARAKPAPAGRSLDFMLAEGSSSNIPPSSFCVASLMRIVLGAASACSRAARLGVSPTIVRSCAGPVPMLADHDEPGRDADPRLDGCRPGAGPPRCRSMPIAARTARSAASSKARGKPK